MTKSGQLAGVLLKGTVACLQFIFRAIATVTPTPLPPPPRILHRIHIELGHFLTSKKRETAKKREILIPDFEKYKK